MLLKVRHVINLLSCNQVDAAISPISHLPAQMIQDQQFAPAALQQHHLILHLQAITL